MRVIGSIATNTFREAVRQPVYLLVVGLGCVVAFFSQYFTFFAFGEEKSMIKEMGLATVSLCGLLLAVFSSSSVIADEIEKLTVLTILCKPVKRWEFIVGKFFGILLAVLVAFLILGVVFLAAVWFAELPFSYVRALYGHVDPDWEPNQPRDFGELVAKTWANLSTYLPGTGLLMIKGLVLAYFQVVVIVAIAVAVSTRLPMIVNMVVCATVYAFGHVSNSLTLYFYPSGPTGEKLVAQTDALGLLTILGKYPGLGVMQILRTLAPNLENFNVWDDIAFGFNVPVEYMGIVVLYGLVYATMMLLVAIVLFRGREAA